MTSIVEQPQLPLARRPAVTEIPLEIVMRGKDLLAAINLCIDVSGLDDKELSITLGIDAAQWSRIRKGDAHFPPRKLGALMDLCGNEVPLIWLARTRGYTLVQIETETQRQLREERDRSAELEKRLQWAEGLLRGRA